MMTRVEKAVRAASDRMRNGRAPALAIYLAAREYGVGTRDISVSLATHRRRRRQDAAAQPVNAWWEK